MSMIASGKISEGLSHTEKLTIYKNNLEELTEDLKEGKEIEFKKVEELVKNINGLLKLKFLEKRESSDLASQLGKFYVDYLVPSLRSIDNYVAWSVAKTLTDPVWKGTAMAMSDPISKLITDPVWKGTATAMSDPRSELIDDWSKVHKQEDFHGS